MVNIEALIIIIIIICGDISYKSFGIIGRDLMNQYAEDVFRVTAANQLKPWLSWLWDSDISQP